MSEITTVVCDFGGVLTGPLMDAFAGINERHSLVGAELGTAMATVSEREGAHILFELECGRLTEPEFVSMLGTQLSLDVGREVDLSRFSEHFFEGLPANALMIEEMAALRAAGYRMGMLTNNVREWGPLWRAKLPVDDIFEVVVDSAYEGMRKPDPAIYSLTCERLGVTPQECVFVDDFEHNCEAAAALGMNPVWFRESDQAIKDLRSLLEQRGAPRSSSA